MNKSTRYRFRNVWLTPAIVMLCFCAAGVAPGQNLTGAINGIVMDSAGAVIPDATVTIANSDTALIVRKLSTDRGGRYAAPSLLAGTYTVTAQAQGFEITEIKAIALDVDQAIPINITLRVGSVTTKVSVTGASVAPTLEDASASTLIPQKEVTELPLNQRNFLQFLSLQPGVNAGTGTISRGPVGVTGGNNDITFSVNGQAHGSNGFFLDGADFLNHDEDTILGMYPSVDALQEVNLLRDNYGAQYGGNGAAIVNLVTKSGTTQFHGSAYLFFRNQLLNANGYFPNKAGLARTPFRYNDFGYTIGGPLYIPRLLESTKKNTFFFVSGEFLRSAQAATSSTSNVPTQAERQGIFSTAVCISYNAAGKCTATSKTVTNISPAARAFLNDVIDKIPLPNNPDNAQSLLSSFNGILNESQTLARVDHAFGEKLQVFVRFMNDPYSQIAPEGIGGNTQSIPGLATTTAESGAQDILGHVTIVPSPSWVIEGGVSHLRSYDNTHIIGLLSPANAPDFVASLKLPYPVLDSKIPTVTIDGFKLNSPGPLDRINPILQEFVNVTHVMGRNNVLFGINAEKLSSAYDNFNDGNNGGFTFTAPSSTGNAQAIYNQSFADFLIGYATSFSQQNTIVPERYSSSVFEAYAQDNVKVTPRLVLNAGIRYSYWRQPTQSLLAITNFDPNLYNPANAPTIDNTGYICLTAPCKGGGKPNPAYNPLNGIIIPGENSPFGRKVASQPKLNFAPRFGFAWDAFGNGKTAIRGGYGIYYLWPGIWTDTPTGNPPVAISVSGTNVSFDDPSGVASQNTPAALGALGVDSKSAYLQNYNFDVQQEFSGNILLDVAYTGNVGRHIAQSIDTNQPIPGAYVAARIAAAGGITASNTPQLNQIRPYLGYGDISTVMPIFSSSYNSLQTQVRKRFAGDSELGASYTWSRALGIGGAQNVYDLAADYGPSSFQRNHMFAAQFVYELPFYRDQHGVPGYLLGGYQFSGIVNILSGGVSSPAAGSVDPGGVGLLASGSPAPDRPDRVGNPNAGPQTITQYFNTAAFAEVPTSQARPGNAAPGSIYGPSTYLLTLAFMRNIRIGDKAQLQLRAEAFNALNHTNLNGPNTSLTSTSYGQISGAGDPRNMQLATKFTF